MATVESTTKPKRQPTIYNNLPAIQALAISKGGKCLSDVYINSKTNLVWECADGHVFEMRSNSVQSGSWCPQCYDIKKRPFQKRLQLEVFQDIARKHGGKCLSEIYMGVNVKHAWECAEGHTWSALAKAVRHGYWCNKCANSKGKKPRKYTIEDMQTLAIGHSGICLSQEFQSVGKRLQWECAQGHTWESAPADVQAGKWCKKCADSARAKKSRKYTIDDMRRVARERGGRCISDEMIDIRSRLIWECSYGHRWEAKVSNVLHNQRWCPECQIGLGENICRAFFEQLFGTPFKKARPKWLVGMKRRRLELDGYSKKLAIAFEHQGTQHYIESSYFHNAEKKFESIQQRDAIKRKLCKKHGVNLIEIPSILEILGIELVKDFIRIALIRLNIHAPIGFHAKLVDLSLVYRSRQRCEQLSLL